MSFVAGGGPTPAAAAGRMPGLAGVTVAVTGGASGIGLGAARLAAGSGAHVVVGDLDSGRLSDVERAAAVDGLDIVGVELDLRDAAQVEAFVKRAEADHPLRGLVCSAGIAPDSPVLETSLEQWERVLSINLTGTFLTCQAAARAMCAGGAGGSIVNVSAASQTYGAALLGPYNASKAGVVALSKTIARELGPQNIRVNCIAPGSVDTPLWRSRLPAGVPTSSKIRGPIQRIGEPQDLAAAIVFLLSSLSAWITGQNIHVNGGALMY
jgi:NAD(P)-dependent dehydrogenase (short-subunit alcohol dehydrogenase family)